MDDTVDNVIESNHFCWGDGRCNEFMNSAKYANDGGDCLRENLTVAKCNDMDCCDDEKAFEAKICKKRDCDCTKHCTDLSGLCKECCTTTCIETTTNKTDTTTETTTETTTNKTEIIINGVSGVTSRAISIFITIVIISFQI